MAVILSEAGGVRAGGDESAVRSIVVAALHAQQEVGLPPGTYKGGAISPSLAQAMLDTGNAELERYFAGDQLASAKEVLASNVTAQQPGEIRDLAAGINSIDVTSVAIDGDTADVTASADLWAEFGQVQDDGTMVVARPTNTKLYSLTLKRIDGDWFVVDESSEFAPGSEP
jgi:hypothetical protein